jgi:hypothetical protein
MDRGAKVRDLSASHQGHIIEGYIGQKNLKLGGQMIKA